eukprot:CAMPEP_0194276230 /NCGR_PEP_ID=MMETSP0169-20130528/8871_1 /TAXON_ID=218684 /ORGANISM="Corethron pennatum, Strain L29A3" /LENGTH=36 /DNA_ID= /DNA_START= /DNA_END= /DNA_ORIENTATION=
MLKCPPRAAWEHVYSSQGAPQRTAQRRMSKCPIFAA